jgi:hypothetical protein
LRRQITVLSMIMLCIAFYTPITAPSSLTIASESIGSYDIPALMYTEHNPIDITSDADFLAQTDAEGWQGNGTEFVPFLIDRYNITHKGYCIRITNVSLYFIIQHCYLATEDGVELTESNDTAIFLDKVSHGRIDNNICVNKDYAAVYLHASDCWVRYNTFAGNRLGVVFDNSSGWAYGNGVLVTEENSFLIMNSKDCSIDSNEVSASGGHSLLMQESFDCSISSNTLGNDSIELIACGSCQLRFNHLHNKSRIVIDACSDILIDRNEIVSSAQQGIRVNNSEHCSILGNHINSTSVEGIDAWYSLSCNYTGNVISGCPVGILATGQMESMFTYNCVFNQTEYGIWVTSGGGNYLYGNLVETEGLGFLRDDGTNNHWDDGALIGNFMVGIQEGELEISGSAGSIDHFARPISPALISSPAFCSPPIIKAEDESQGALAWVVWQIQLGSLSRYVIMNNSDGPGSYSFEDVIQEGGCTNSFSILLDLSYLAAGSYDLTIILEWAFGLVVWDMILTTFAFRWPDDFAPDADSDGMPDSWELANYLDPMSDDSTYDPDSDGLSNLLEYRTRTDPHNSDSDGDGMRDGWEVSHNLNPLEDDASEDPDHDNMTNLQEFAFLTDPHNNDSDSDLMPDGWEVQYWLNPLIDDSSGDPDWDHLTNLEEFMLGTNPMSMDSDGDFVPDGWEVQNGYDPNDPAASPAEFLIFSAPLIVGISGLVILAVLMLFLGQRYDLLRQKGLADEEKEQERRALQELLN